MMNAFFGSIFCIQQQNERANKISFLQKAT